MAFLCRLSAAAVVVGREAKGAEGYKVWYVVRTHSSSSTHEQQPLTYVVRTISTCYVEFYVPSAHHRASVVYYVLVPYRVPMHRPPAFLKKHADTHVPTVRREKYMRRAGKCIRRYGTGTVEPLIAYYVLYYNCFCARTAPYNALTSVLACATICIRITTTT